MRLYRFRHLSNIDSCIHAISEKRKSEPYAFSMALHTGEDPHSIIANRKKMIKDLKCHDDCCFIVANQTHSDNIAIIDTHKNRGWEQIGSAIEDCDALITNRKNIILSILTADCVPILLMDTRLNIVAAVHAGWRGSKEHIAAKTVKKMCDHFLCDAKDIIAGIGPSIGVCCYEVESHIASYFDTDKSVTGLTQGKYMLDLSEINRQQLLDSGLLKVNIEMSQVCTACTTDRFFSYRKEKGCTGRFISMIGLQ